MQRRQFMRAAAGGTAVVALPGLLGGCGIAASALIAEPLPPDPFEAWFGVDREGLSRLHGLLGANGAVDADLYFQYRRGTQLSLQGGEPGTVSSSAVQGVGMRRMHAGRTAFAHTDDLTEERMLACAKQLAPGAAAAVRPPFVLQSPGELYRTDVPWSDIGAEKKAALLARVDALARAADTSVSDVRVVYSDSDERVLMSRQDGQLVIDERPMTQLSAQVTMTRGGVSHSGFAVVAARDEFSWYTDERLESLVADAVARTEILFDARRPPSGEMPVILSAGNCGVVLHEAIGHSLEADFVRSGDSPLWRGKKCPRCRCVGNDRR